ncbi:uncharacterized protein BDW70DRAFT_125750 [Aspergillus foveolatus]|uniref:uncharacterized protein n=1 Tax=Aspergillus foveolatus TaxID=210207 RepID=UPI003CCCA59A
MTQVPIIVFFAAVLFLNIYSAIARHVSIGLRVIVGRTALCCANKLHLATAMRIKESPEAPLVRYDQADNINVW